MEEIKKIVEKHFETNIQESNRKFINVVARGCYYKIARESLGISYQRIGYTLNKNHATVMHGIKMINDLIDTDKQFKLTWQELINKFTYYNKLKKKLTNTELIRQVNRLLVKNEKLKKENENLKQTIYQLADLE